MPHVLVESQMYIGREHARIARSGRAENIGHTRRRGHDGVVRAALLLLVNLVKAVPKLMAGAAQERSRRVALLLVLSCSEEGRVRRWVPIVAEAGGPFARDADLVVHDSSGTSHLGGHDDQVKVPLLVEVGGRVADARHQRVQVRRRPAIGCNDTRRHGYVLLIVNHLQVPACGPEYTPEVLTAGPGNWRNSLWRDRSLECVDFDGRFAKEGRNPSHLKGALFDTALKHLSLKVNARIAGRAHSVAQHNVNGPGPGRRGKGSIELAWWRLRVDVLLCRES